MDGKWDVVPGKVTNLAVGGDGSVWAIGVLQSNSGGTIIYHYNPNTPSSWDQVDGGAIAIAVGPDGQPWIVNKQGAIFRRGVGKTGYVDETWIMIAANGTASNIGRVGRCRSGHPLPMVRPTRLPRVRAARPRRCGTRSWPGALG